MAGSASHCYQQLASSLVATTLLSLAMLIPLSCKCQPSDRPPCPATYSDVPFVVPNAGSE